MEANNHRYHVPDLVAPGEGVYSSVVGGGYEAWDGTSMATPIVSAVAALVLERHPNITLGQLEEELLTTCRDLKLADDRQGKGLIQVKAAL
jgi:subtilisin family serine protease